MEYFKTDKKRIFLNKKNSISISPILISFRLYWIFYKISALVSCCHHDEILRYILIFSFDAVGCIILIGRQFYLIRINYSAELNHVIYGRHLVSFNKYSSFKRSPANSINGYCSEISWEERIISRKWQNYRKWLIKLLNILLNKSHLA
jgi:hypothetical protein